MENFDIVLVLARIAMDADGNRATQQIERLKDALAKSDKEQSTKLERLLTRAGRRHSMAPLALDEMRMAADAVRQQMPGEILSTSTLNPVDRETGTPLARIVFPNTERIIAPILSASLTAAIDDLLSEWNRSDELAKVGAKPLTTCLIYGPPGVGKTLLARYIANCLNLPCVEARLEGLVSSFLGTTARNIGALFDFANRYRCVLFLDEFDAVAKARDDAQEIGEIKRVVNTLLQSLDARNGRGITLAATNHEQLLDVAIWRRFESRIELHQPSAEVREEMLTSFLKPLPVRQGDLNFLVWATEGMSGADIEILIEAGKRFLVLHRKISPNDNGREMARRPTQIPLILEALRRQATLNARLFNAGKAVLLTGPIKDLDQALERDGFTQADRGSVLGISQSAVSRRRKRGEDITE